MTYARVQQQQQQQRSCLHSSIRFWGEGQAHAIILATRGRDLVQLRHHVEAPTPRVYGGAYMSDLVELIFRRMPPNVGFFLTVGC